MKYEKKKEEHTEKMRTRLLSHKEIEETATTLQYIHIYDRADNIYG